MTTEQARRVVGQAEQEHLHESQRLEAARTEAEAYSRQIAEADPDTDQRFAKLVAQRDAARGRAEALETRVRRCEATLSRAREELVALETGERLAAAQRLCARMDAQSRTLNQTVLDARLRLRDLVKDLQATYLEALEAYQALPPERRGELGDPTYKTPWSNLFIAQHADILVIGAGIAKEK